jgi:hypothetical protein
LEVEQLISYGFQQAEIKDRFIRFSGKAKIVNQEPERVSLFFQGKRVDVDQDSKGNWYSEINGINSNRKDFLTNKEISKLNLCESCEFI